MRHRRALISSLGAPEPTLFSKIYEYTGTVQQETLPPGVYLLECWGAQGGCYGNDIGGFGGYSRGILEVTQDTQLYIYAGGQPATVSTLQTVVPGGFNGGGDGFTRGTTTTSNYAQGGGGASDIRIGQDSLYARVIVAGGGAGSVVNRTDGTQACGGGLQGGLGISTNTFNASYVQAGQTQESTSVGRDEAGTFGQGHSAYTRLPNYPYAPGGGGGGWYGGYVYYYANNRTASYANEAGGGSGYVYTESSAENYPEGCLLNSSYYLTDAETIAGSQEGYQHLGNGRVSITQVGVVYEQWDVYRDGFWNPQDNTFARVFVYPDRFQDTTTIVFTGETMLYVSGQHANGSNYSITFDSIQYFGDGREIEKPDGVGAPSAYNFTSGMTITPSSHNLRVLGVSNLNADLYPIKIVIKGLKINPV